MSRKTYGIDEYGRYVEIDGTRYAIEPHPYRRGITRSAWWRIHARCEMFVWWINGGSRNDRASAKDF